MNITATTWAVGLHHVSTGESGYKYAPNSNNALTDSSGTDSITEPGTGMNISSESSKGGSSNVYISGGTGYLTVDTSRYHNYNAIPGLRFGLDINNVTSDGESSLQYISFNGQRVAEYTDQCAATWSGCRIFDSGANISGFDCAIDETLQQIGISGYASCKKSLRTDSISGDLTINMNYVNKTLLRSRYRYAAGFACEHKLFDNPQNYGAYFAVMKKAADVLGDPTATADDISEAVRLLSMIDKDTETLSQLRSVTINNVKVIESAGSYHIADVSTRVSLFMEGDSFACQSMSFSGYEYLGCQQGFDLASVDLLNTQSTVSVEQCADNYTFTFYYKACSYSVNFDSNGGTDGSMEPQVFCYDVPQALNANSYRRSYSVTYDYNGATDGNTVTTAAANSTFNGWAVTPSGPVIYKNSQMVCNLTSSSAAEVTLYANWTPNYISLPSPTKTGYTFDGWYSGSIKIGTGGSSYQPTRDITLTAKWTAA